MQRKWWQEAIVYQIYPKSFQDTNGDGIGDLKGVIKRLDYLEELGINVIWLCPINASPMRDNGYDISDYYKIDPSFGTNEDLEELIWEAEKRKIKIVMDLVVNHCSEEHKWFQDVIKNPDSEYKKYFVLKETDGEAPNNLRCYNGYNAWERIGDSNRFYFHAFSKEQPDLNWENKELREEIINMMKFWQKKGIAGFRIDAIGNLKKSSELFEITQFPSDGNDGMVSIDSYTLMQDGIEEYLSELRDEVFDKYDMMTVAEVNVPEEKMQQFIGDHGLFSMVFDFSYTDLDIEKINGLEWKKEWTIKEFKEKMFKSQEILQKYGWGSPYLENHDQPRSVNKYLPEDQLNDYSKTALGTIFFFLRGTPFIYQGQELGMENYPFQTIDEIRDPFAIKRYEQAKERGDNTEQVLKYFRMRGRDNGRIPMQWSAEKNAGFSEAEPWILVNPDYTDRNVEEEKANPKSVLSYYKKMIHLRKNSKYHEVLTFGDFEAVDTEVDEIICYKRTDETYEVFVLVNMSSQNQALPKECTDGEIILHNREMKENMLLPYEARLIIKKK